MRNPTPLPEPLSSRPFGIGDALERGVTAGRLDAGDLIIPYRGVRDHAGAGSDLVSRCAQYAPRLTPWQFYSHDTALALYGAPVPMGGGRILHVSAHRPRREPRIAGIAGHRLQERDAATRVIHGLPVESPVRAWRQVAASWRLDDVVAAGDYLVGRGHLATLPELAAEVDVGGRGAGLLATALGLIRAGSESSEETRLRLVLARAGLPEPELNWELRTGQGRFVARLDLAYPRWRVAPEYDGRQHAESTAQFETDADRWHAIREEEWDLVRILRHHLRGDGARAVARVEGALRRAGWRP